jgi:hypothetical protein
MIVVVKLMGGLGNQMFQYAAAFSLAQKNNAKLIVDKSCNTLKIHQYSLEKFNLNCTFVNFYYILNFFIRCFQKIDSLIFKRIGISFFKKYFYFEKNFDFDENFLNIKNSQYITGYFQSEKYFMSCSDLILEQFFFPKEIEFLNKDLIEKIKNCQSVSLHVRRGDYVKNELARKLHGDCCPFEYYDQALKYIVEKLGNIELFIFSDEIKWVKQNFKFEQPVNFVDNNTSSNFSDLRLMSLCKHNIIANSSFSWWGAYLNKNKDKIVIAPKKWFNNNSLNTSDLIPEGWVKL